jgi:hypothetical protein
VSARHSCLRARGGLRTSQGPTAEGGGGKIIGHLETLHPDWPLPARQVLHKHFVCEGLVQKRRRSRKRPHPGKPTAPFDAPNSVWSADFKGHFKTRDGIYCYPLAVQDGFSRYLLACQGLGGTTYAGTRRVFTRLFEKFGQVMPN